MLLKSAWERRLNYDMHSFNTEIIIIDEHNRRDDFNKFPDIFRMGNFIDSTHMKL